MKRPAPQEMRLKDHSHVGIVGGGPAGSFAALHLLHLSQLHDLHLSIHIYEPRDFSRRGPSGCNRCAGVLSSRLWGYLSDLGLEIPRELIQAELQHYSIHLDGETIHLDRPDPERRIISVYRGGGPRMIDDPPELGFDYFLLKKAIERGAVHIPNRVRKVTWEDRPIIHSQQGTLPVDLLVLAIGVNSRSPLDASFRYRPPHSEIMAQDEVLRPENWSPDEVNAYFRQPQGLSFGAIVPKGRYLNISLLGQGFTRDSVDEFITAQNLGDELQYAPSSSLCGCNPRIAVSSARHYFGDRWVAVGDAAATRLYKDGIGSAYQTTLHAMSTAVQVGLSHADFRQHYAPVCRAITRDNAYGFLLFRLWNFVLGSPLLLNAWKDAILRESSLPVSQRKVRRVLWGMLTGDEPYRRLMMGGISPLALIHIGSAIRPRRRGG